MKLKVETTGGVTRWSLQKCVKKPTTLSCFGEIFNLSIIKIISVFLTLSHLEQSAEGQMISDVKKKTHFIVIRETCGAFYSSVTLRAPQKLIGQIDSKQVIDYEGLKGMFDAAMTHNHSVTRDSVLQNTYFLICMCFMGSTGVFFFEVTFSPLERNRAHLEILCFTVTATPHLFFFTPGVLCSKWVGGIPLWFYWRDFYNYS